MLRLEQQAACPEGRQSLCNPSARTWVPRVGQRSEESRGVSDYPQERPEAEGRLTELSKQNLAEQMLKA